MFNINHRVKEANKLIKEAYKAEKLVVLSQDGTPDLMCDEIHQGDEVLVVSSEGVKLQVALSAEMNHESKFDASQVIDEWEDLELVDPVTFLSEYPEAEIKHLDPDNHQNVYSVNGFNKILEKLVSEGVIKDGHDLNDKPQGILIASKGNIYEMFNLDDKGLSFFKSGFVSSDFFEKHPELDEDGIFEEETKEAINKIHKNTVIWLPVPESIKHVHHYNEEEGER